MNRYPVTKLQNPLLPAGTKGISKTLDLDYEGKTLRLYNWEFSHEGYKLVLSESDINQRPDFFEWREDKPEPVTGVIRGAGTPVFSRDIRHDELQIMLAAINGEMFTREDTIAFARFCIWHKKAFRETTASFEEWLNIPTP